MCHHEFDSDAGPCLHCHRTVAELLDDRREEQEAIAEAIQKAEKEEEENLKRLASCSGPHDFLSGKKYTDSPASQTYVCSKCGGILIEHDYSWYMQGLTHGSKS